MTTHIINVYSAFYADKEHPDRAVVGINFVMSNGQNKLRRKAQPDRRFLAGMLDLISEQLEATLPTKNLFELAELVINVYSKDRLFDCIQKINKVLPIALSASGLTESEQDEIISQCLTYSNHGKPKTFLEMKRMIKVLVELNSPTKKVTLNSAIIEPGNENQKVAYIACAAQVSAMKSGTSNIIQFPHSGT